MALGIPNPPDDDGHRQGDEGTVWSVSVGSEGDGGGDGSAGQDGGADDQPPTSSSRPSSSGDDDDDDDDDANSDRRSQQGLRQASSASIVAAESSLDENQVQGGQGQPPTKGIDPDKLRDLPGRYKPESMRLLDVEATLATLEEDVEGDGNYSYVGGGGSYSYTASGGPYRPSITTRDENRRKRRRFGITTMIFLGAAGVTAAAILATFGAIELEEVYGWVRGDGGEGDGGGGEGSSSIMTMGFISSSSSSSSNHHSKKHVLVDRTADCEDIPALYTHEGWAACERACMSASCCHEPPGDKLSCVSSKTKPLCDKYIELCGQLHTIVEPPGGRDGDKEAVTYVPPAPDNLSTICSEGSIATAAGLMQCEEACHYSRCCKYRAKSGAPNGKLRNCYSGNEDACLMYDRPCHVLPGFDHDKSYEEAMKNVHNVLSSSERNEAIISDLCSENSLQQHVGRESCKEVCRSHLCCFAGAGYGMENMNACPPKLADECSAYLPCRIAYLSGIGKGEDPYNSEDEFDNKSYVLEAVSHECREGGHRCHEVCDAHMCCFVEDVSECSAKKGEACDVFEPCKILLPP